MWETRIARLFGILSYLSPHSQITLNDMAQIYEVHRRTIERDIEILQSATLGIFMDEDRIKISRMGYKKIQSWMLG